MYTLTLSDIKVNPPIPEDKKFEAEHPWEAEQQAVEYIKATYGDAYNPITIQRLAANAVKDAEGLTSKDRSKAEWDEIEKRMDEKNAASSQAQDAIDAEYAPKLDEITAWRDAERDKVNDEYRPRLEELTGDEREALEEERDLKLDDIELEYRKKYDVVWNEKAAKVDQAWKQDVEA